MKTGDYRNGLDALQGIAFVIDRDGNISSIGSKHWDAFACHNDAPDLRADTLIGQNLFDYVSGADLKEQLKQVVARVVDRPDTQLVLDFRCDAPARLRRIRQTISALPGSGTKDEVLFQSVEVEAHDRPPINLFRRHRDLPLDTKDDRPIVRLCSWCQRVQFAPIGGDDWLDTEEFARKGGPDQTRITHCICDDCFKLQDIDQSPPDH